MLTLPPRHACRLPGFALQANNGIQAARVAQSPWQGGRGRAVRERPPVVLDRAPPPGPGRGASAPAAKDGRREREPNCLEGRQSASWPASKNGHEPCRVVQARRQGKPAASTRGVCTRLTKCAARSQRVLASVAVTKDTGRVSYDGREHLLAGWPDPSRRPFPGLAAVCFHPFRAALVVPGLPHRQGRPAMTEGAGQAAVVAADQSGKQVPTGCLRSIGRARTLMAKTHVNSKSGGGSGCRMADQAIASIRIVSVTSSSAHRAAPRAPTRCRRGCGGAWRAASDAPGRQPASAAMARAPSL